MIPLLQSQYINTIIIIITCIINTIIIPPLQSEWQLAGDPICPSSHRPEPRHVLPCFLKFSEDQSFQKKILPCLKISEDQSLEIFRRRSAQSCREKSHCTVTPLPHHNMQGSLRLWGAKVLQSYRGK